MQILFNIVSCLLGTFSKLIFFHTFFNKQKQQIPFIVLPITFLSVELLTMVVPTVVHTGNESTDTVFLTLFSFFLTLLLTLFYSATLRHRIFITLSFHAILILSEVLIFVFFPASQAESLVADNNQINYIWSLISTCISLCVIIVLCHILRMHRYNYSIKYTLLMLITPILSIAIIIITFDFSHYQIYEISLFQLCLLLGLYLMNIVHYYLFSHVLRSTQLTSENHRLQEQIEFQTNKYQQISTAYKNTRSMLHDTKQHFLYLESCLDHENYAVIKEYLPTAIRKLEQSYNRINTGNLVIDAFLSNYLTISENENILFITDIQIDPALIPISDYDLCIILGNLLDNCIHAIRQISPLKERKISVRLFTKGGNFVINIINSYEAPEKKGQKNDDLFHGYGCKNIEQITLRANGTYTTDMEDNAYMTIISLPYNV